MEKQSIETPGAQASTRPIRMLPVTPFPPGAIRLVPSNITDADTKATVDAKLNAALKEAIKDAIGSTNPDVEAMIDTLPLDYHALIKQTVLSVIENYRGTGDAQAADSPARRNIGRADKLRERRRSGVCCNRTCRFRRTRCSQTTFAKARRSKRCGSRNWPSLSSGSMPEPSSSRLGMISTGTTRWSRRSLRRAARRSVFTTELSRLTGEQYGLVAAARKAGLGA